MTEKQTVVLCGKSLFMTGVALHLEKDKDLQVIKAFSPEQAEKISQDMELAVIITDSAADDWEWVCSFKGKWPNIPIVALNPEESAAVIYSCHQQEVESIQQLKMLLENSIFKNNR